MDTAAITTAIWHEEPEIDNPFASRVSRCHGYDVYGDLLGRISWIEMLFLLIRGEPPSPSQGAALETLAVALANPGPRDPSVHAAMCGGIGGSTSASCLMAALAVAAGGYGGAHEVAVVMENCLKCGTDLDAWQHCLVSAPGQVASIWPDMAHPAGFDPHAVNTALPVIQLLDQLVKTSGGTLLTWLREHRGDLENSARHPIAMTGIAAATFHDLGMSPQQGEMLYLFLRLPGAAAHALEQTKANHRRFPFFSLNLLDNPSQETP